MNESIYDNRLVKICRNILKWNIYKYKASLAQQNIWGIKSCITLLETSDFY